MKNKIIAVVSTLITALLIWLFAHFVILDVVAKKSSHVGQTESYDKINALVQNSEFTKSDLKRYLQADEYQNLEGQSKWMAGAIFMLTCLTVAIYSGIKLAITKLTPNKRMHSITASGGSE